MRIDSRDALEGIPLLDIRAAFRECGLDGLLSADFVCERFRLTSPQTERLIATLKRLKFIKPVSTRKSGQVTTGSWVLTKQGIRLRAAAAAKPIRRATADRLLSDLLERITELNKDDHFLGRVRKVIVFGSYIGDADPIGDIDVAVEIVRRDPDFEKHALANNRRVTEEVAAGRRFSNIIEQAFWWQREAMFFLRNRKRALSLQDYSSISDIVSASPHRVVFEDSAQNSPAPKRRRQERGTVL